MGNSPSAENVADTNLSAIASVVNDAVQNCGQEIDQQIVQNIFANNTKIRDSLTLKAENYLVLKEGCLQSETASTQLDQALQATAAQTAQAIAQQFELNSAKAKNVIDINAQIASEVKNNFVQICANQVDQDIRQNVKLSDDEIAGSVTINAKNYQESMVKCSTQGQAITDLKDQLIVQINQSATAKVENFLLPFLIALLVIVGFIALFLFLPKLFEKKQPERNSNNDDSIANILANVGKEAGGGGGGGEPGISAEGGGATENPPTSSTPATTGPADGKPSWGDKLDNAKTNLGNYISQAEGAVAQAKEFGGKAKELFSSLTSKT